MRALSNLLRIEAVAASMLVRRRRNILAMAPRTPQLDTGYDRLDRRQIDMVVALPALLRLGSSGCAAMVARASHDTFSLVGRLGQRSMLALARWSFGCLRLATLAALLVEIVLGWRDV